MKLEDVKKSLGRMVSYKGVAGVYRLTACILRKADKTLFYQAELLDVRHGRSVIICKLEDVEVSE